MAGSILHGPLMVPLSVPGDHHLEFRCFWIRHKEQMCVMMKPTSPLEMAERMRTLSLKFLSGDRSTDTDCVVKDTHPGFGLGPFSVLAFLPMLDSVSNLLLIALTP